MLKSRKSQTGIITIPFEIKVEVVMIALFLVFSTVLIAAILQNNEYVHNYYKKDISMVQNSVLLLPYDLDFSYKDHSKKNQMDKLGFEIDKYYTSTLSQVGQSVRKDGYERHYIHLFNENSLDFKSFLDLNEKPYFRKVNGNFIIGNNNNLVRELEECKDFKYNSFKDKIYLDADDNVYKELARGDNRFVKHTAGINVNDGMYMKINIVQEDGINLYMTNKKNTLSCNLYYKLSPNVYFVDNYVDNYYDKFIEYVELDIPQKDISKFKLALNSVIGKNG